MARLATATFIALIGAFTLAAFWAPTDGQQGIDQKIFYLHAPLALIALGGFVAGGVFAAQHLRTDDRRYDLRSYVAIHLSLILAVGVLITGAIWGKSEWGAWWRWDAPTLVAFLIVFLLYATYQPLRFSIEDPERQSRYASVFAIVAGVFVPVNFAAVRFTQTEPIHPRTLDKADGGMPTEMLITFLVSLVALTLLFMTLYRFELAAKETRFRVRALRRRMAGDPDVAFARARSAVPEVIG